MALVCAGSDALGAMFEWLDRGYAARAVHLVFLPVDPKWDPFRKDPRFQALLARCDFHAGSAAFIARRAALMVLSTSFSVCAPDRNQASNCDGGR
jgi:hypothetical protein